MILSSDTILEYLRAMGEGTRLRILALLASGDLAVGELVQALGQSQPRLSHHLKILANAGLVERLPEGAWVFYRWPTTGSARRFLDKVFEELDQNSGDFARDARQLKMIQTARQTAAEAHFNEMAETWDTIRALHSPNEAIERDLLTQIANRRFEHMVDVGTGTGRMLALFSPHVGQAEGIDFSHDMLTVARARLTAGGITNARVRQGDAAALPLPDDVADLVTIHQVLHFLDAPEAAIAEASRILRPGGQILIVDFAPHDLEFLRTQHGHRRLGIRNEHVRDWASARSLALAPPRTFAAPADAGLQVVIWSGQKQAAPKTAAA